MTEKVDWRNYDYSEGPPRKPNPSPVENSSSRLSSQLSTSVLSTNRELNNNNSSTTRRNAMPHLAVKHSLTTSTGSTSASNLSLTASPPPLNEKEDGGHGKKVNSKYRLSTNLSSQDVEEEPKPRLAYRPPSSTTPTAAEGENEEENPSNAMTTTTGTTRTNGKASPLTKRSILESGTGGMNERRMKAVTLDPSLPSEEDDMPFDMVGNGGGSGGIKHRVAKGPVVSLSPKPNQNQAWEEAEKEWKEAEQEEKSLRQHQNVVSDDNAQEDEEDNLDTEELPPTQDLDAGDILYEQGEAYEFESFAGDRSTATGMTSREGGIGFGVTVGSSVGGTTAAGMEVEVNANAKPVSILRSSRRFEGTALGVNEIATGAESDGRSVSSMKRRTHPWDADSTSQTVDPISEVQQGFENQTHENNEQNVALVEDDDDTLFKFNEDGSKVTSGSKRSSSTGGGSGSKTLSKKELRRRTRLRKEESLNQVVDSDSCDSIEADVTGKPSPKKRGDTLQDRTKQAWSARNKSLSNSREDGGVKPSNNGVSFQGDSTVHTYQQEEEYSDSGSSDDSYTEYSDYDDETIYTKGEATMVEDMFLDFFMIGDDEPRSSRKHKPRRKVYIEDDNTVGDLSTLDGSITQTNRNRRKKGKDELETVPEDDAFTKIYNTVEQGISNCFQSMGLITDPNDPNTKQKEHEKKKNDERSVSTVETSISQWAHYAADLLFSTGPTARSEDEDGDLVQLAMSAAKVKHLKNHMQYDESVNMDVRTDIQFIVITVGLPIGILFGENEFCCWVDDIFPNGNVAKKSKGDKLEIGDHLASINGLNAMNLSITEVCKILANVANPNEIELTFLRYVGPYRPLAGEHQQGYEVIDPQINVEATNRSGVIDLVKKASTVNKKAYGSPKRGSSPAQATATSSPIKENKPSRGTVRKSLTPQREKKTVVTTGIERKKEQSNPSPNTKKKRFGFFRRKKKGEKKGQKRIS